VDWSIHSWELAGAAVLLAGIEPRDAVLVVVPTYDERDALPLFVERFDRTGLELLIVDDNSPDGTSGLADALAVQRPWMHVMHRDEKDGLGMAYRAGFARCLAAGYDVIVRMECDLSHPPEKLAEMRRVLLEHDAGLVLGSATWRAAAPTAGAARAWPFNRAGCGASRVALGLPFSDLSGGSKLWRATAWR
jgi:dolichol-phosphate mannosyltransferase